MSQPRVFQPYDIWEIDWPHDDPQGPGDESKHRPGLLISTPVQIANGQLDFLKFSKSDPRKYNIRYVRVTHGGVLWQGSNLPLTCYLHIQKSERLPDDPMKIIWRIGRASPQLAKAFIAVLRNGVNVEG